MSDVSTLTDELRALLNRRSRESASNTPDFMLAEYMIKCLEAAEEMIRHRDRWYGIAPAPGQPYVMAGTQVRER